MSQFPPPAPMPTANMSPHRGVAILVLGILGLVICVICGIIAWVMANSDLQAMARGEMDPMGEGLTKAGKICGIISVVLTLAGFGIGILIMILGIGAAAASGA